MKHYYAGHNGYGINVSFLCGAYGWSVKRFDNKSDRDSWVDQYLCNDNGNVVSQALTRAQATIILGAGEWVDFDGWLINKKNDPRG